MTFLHFVLQLIAAVLLDCVEYYCLFQYLAVGVCMKLVSDVLSVRVDPATVIEGITYIDLWFRRYLSKLDCHVIREKIKFEFFFHLVMFLSCTVISQNVLYAVIVTVSEKIDFSYAVQIISF